MATIKSGHYYDLREYALFEARRFCPDQRIPLDRALAAANEGMRSGTSRIAALEFYRLAAANAIAHSDAVEGAERERYLDVAARAALRALHRDGSTDPILLE
jgi:hypothetical protein